MGIEPTNKVQFGQGQGLGPVRFSSLIASWKLAGRKPI